MDKNKKVVSYRLPLDLIEKIKESAITNHRCINNQVIHLLTTAFAESKQITVKEPEIILSDDNETEQAAKIPDRKNGNKKSPRSIRAKNK